MSENYNLFYFFKQFPDEDASRKYLEKRRWGNTPVCPHCGNAQKVYRYKNGKTFKCAHCGKQFKVTTGTIYVILFQNYNLTFFLLPLLSFCMRSNAVTTYVYCVFPSSYGNL